MNTLEYFLKIQYCTRVMHLTYIRCIRVSKIAMLNIVFQMSTFGYGKDKKCKGLAVTTTTPKKKTIN